ncbi:MAG: MFS transporter [Prochloraceae cyanobacterium]
MPTIILFYQSHGVNLEQAVLLKTILSLSILLLEVPSGYLADLKGRKFCLVAGSGIWIVGWLFYCFGDSFAIFAVAEILSGIAGSLISGADTAIAYETLLLSNKESYYRSYQSRLVAIAGISEACCGLIGAAVAQINLSYPFYLQTVCLIIFFVITLTLIEPEVDRQIFKNKPAISLKAIASEAFRHNDRLRWLIFLSSTFSMASFLIVWLSQGYFQQIDLPIAAMGITWAVFHFLMSLAGLYAVRLENTLGTKKAFLVLCLVLAFSYILLGSISSMVGIAAIALIYMVRGTVSPLVLNLINRAVPSNIRATVLSLNSFTFRLGFILIAPIIGAISSQYSLSLALLISGCFFGVIGSLFWFQLFNKKTLQ